MAGQTAWLDGRIRWQEGRVVWETDRGPVAPEPADLALAQRRLRQIGGSPEAARRTLGDVEAWLAERQSRLELAKRLAPLRAPALPALTDRARARDADAVARLVELMPAEALCSNDLPASPCAALVAAGALAEPPLLALLEDESAPLAARALAALALGAVRGRSSARAAVEERGALARSAWLQRAYRRGANDGLPSEPVLVTRLLADEDGPALARRCLQALASSSPFRLSPELLRELLARGVAASRVVALAEAAVEAEALAERIGADRGDLPGSGPERRSAAERRRRQQTEGLAALAEISTAFARSSGEPAVIGLLTRLGNALLDLGGSQPTALEALQWALRTGLEVAPEHQRAYLELLVSFHGRVWSPPRPQTIADDLDFDRWLRNTQAEWVEPIAALLEKTGDSRLVGESIDLELIPLLRGCRWEDAGRYRAFLRLARDLEVRGYEFRARWLLSALDTLRDGSEALAALGPLAVAMRSLESDLRWDLMFALEAAAPATRRELLDCLPRVTPRLMRIAGFIGSRSREWCGECVTRPLVGAALALDHLAPDRSDACLDWVLARARALESDQTALEREISQAELAVRVAAGLADDLEHFQRLASAVMEHHLGWRVEQAERGLPTLRRFPRTKAALAHLLPPQPRRCLELLERIGLVTRLGSSALAPLDALEPEPGVVAAPPEEWRDVLQAAPELASGAQSYLAARRLTGSPLQVPSGVAGALAQPMKFRNELEYLERRLADQPDRADLSKRVASLRARLADAEGILEAARREAAERLEQHTAEAWLAASEQQVLACYRGRLATVVGRIPEDLELDADLLNATLLTVDITRNRRLLLRLLRAHLAGDRDWVRRQPANAAFLVELHQRGVDSTAWLRPYPRAYRCSAVFGGRVRLRLESDPLRILQMGNYFDTCLSFGGINAFSTVANACDLNKRVVYATDAAGRVVGRKLIALNADYELVGFRTYTSLSDDGGNQALRAIFRRYCGDFAQRCGLQLADDGTVPTLVARHWYDDGAVAWGDEIEPPDSASDRHAAHRSPAHSAG